MNEWCRRWLGVIARRLMVVCAGAAFGCASQSDEQLPGPPAWVTTIPLPRIPSGAERSDYVVTDLANSAPVLVRRIEWRSPKGLHHSRVDAPTSSGDIRPIFTAPVGAADWYEEMPPGFALLLNPRQQLGISWHYVNASAESIDGSIELRLSPLPDGEHAVPLGLAMFLDSDITLPPHARTDVETTCLLRQPLELHSVLSHTHRAGRGVEAFRVGGEHDGERIYAATSWDEAPVVWESPPLQFAAGEGIRWICHFENEGDDVIRAGPDAAEEMCGVGGYHRALGASIRYEKLPGADCTATE